MSSIARSAPLSTVHVVLERLSVAPSRTGARSGRTWLPKALLLCAAFAGMSMGGAVAHDQYFEHPAAGDGWRAFRGISDKGRKMCVISADNGERYLGIKYFEGDPHAIVQLSQRHWPAYSSPLRVELQFDRSPPEVVYAQPFRMGHEGALELTISRTFVKQILWAHKLYVRFPGSGMGEGWESDLSGAKSAAYAWKQCVHTMFNIYGEGDDV